MLKVAGLAVIGVSFLMMSNAIERAAAESLALGHLDLSEYLWASNSFYLLGLLTVTAAAVFSVVKFVR